MATPPGWNESEDVKDVIPGYDRIGGRTYRSVDVNHGKPGHLCSSLCGAAMWDESNPCRCTVPQIADPMGNHAPGCPAIPPIDFDLRAERGISPDDVDE